MCPIPFRLQKIGPSQYEIFLLFAVWVFNTGSVWQIKLPQANWLFYGISTGFFCEQGRFLLKYIFNSLWIHFCVKHILKVTSRQYSLRKIDNFCFPFSKWFPYYYSVIFSWTDPYFCTQFHARIFTGFLSWNSYFSTECCFNLNIRKVGTQRREYIKPKWTNYTQL